MQATNGTITTYQHNGEVLKTDSYDYYLWMPIKNLDGQKFARIAFLKYSTKLSRYVAVYHLDANNSSEMFFASLIKCKKAEFTNNGTKVKIEKENPRILVKNLKFSN